MWGMNVLKRDFLRSLMGLFILAGCVTGPEKEPKSPLNYLNGDHYQSTVHAGPVPLVIERRDVPTTIAGEVRIGDGNFQRPARFVTVKLLRLEREVASATTDEKGAFVFSGNIPDGEYVARVDAGPLGGRRTVVVRGYTNSVGIIGLVRKNE